MSIGSLQQACRDGVNPMRANEWAARGAQKRKQGRFFKRWAKAYREEGQSTHQLNRLPVVFIVSFPCLTPLTLMSASDTFLMSAPWPLTTSTSRQ